MLYRLLNYLLFKKFNPDSGMLVMLTVVWIVLKAVSPILVKSTQSNCDEVGAALVKGTPTKRYFYPTANPSLINPVSYDLVPVPAVIL